MPNLTMGQEGSHFAGDGVQLSWPQGGKRQIVPQPAELSLRLRQRIAEGRIVVTDEEANMSAYVPPSSRIIGRSRQLWPNGQRAVRVEMNPDVESVKVHEPAVEPDSEPATATAAPAKPVRRRSTSRGRRTGTRRRRPA